jgi:hypothetical protein
LRAFSPNKTPLTGDWHFLSATRKLLQALLNVKKFSRLATSLIAIFCCRSFAAEFNGLLYSGDDLFADTWVAVDGAGRTIPGFDKCGPVKKDKWVGIFYWTWHTSARRGPYDNTKLLAQAKAGDVDWPEPGDYHWGEPELGYYVMTDPFVIRKHAMANPEFIKDKEMLAFFTYRRPMPDYWNGPSGPNQWSWLEVYPQHVFKNTKGEAEQMSVGVTQNALPGTPGPAPMSHKAGAMGRSWHQGKKEAAQNAVNLGLNFQEQWSRVLELDPKFVFVTGWNEWTAGRYTQWSKYVDDDCYFKGGLFVDQYTQEYSRDCEPMRGGHSDNYYYQLSSWVRRFKGVRPTPRHRGPDKIVMDGIFHIAADRKRRLK